MKLTCPDTRRWQTFLDDSIAREDRVLLESHLAHCAICRVRLIALADAANERQVSHTLPASLRRQVQRLSFGRPGSGSHINLWKRYMPLAVAATIVLAIGLSIALYRSGTRPQGTSEFRQTGRPGGELLLINPPNSAELESGKHEFRWGGVGGSVRYEFTITDAKGDIVFQQKVTGNSITLDTQTSKLLSHTKYYWTVTATLPDGTKRESGVAAFLLK